MEKTENKSSTQSLFEYYNHPPSFRTVAIGMEIGVVRILTAQLCLNTIPRLGTCFSQSNKVNPFAITAFIAPFVEEVFFRKDLEKESLPKVLRSVVIFGLMHGLLPGSLEQRVARVFMSTVGGVFYTAAQQLTGDIWSPAIAHFMYNVFNFFKPLF